MKSIASRLFMTSLLVILLSLSVAGWVISLAFEDSVRSDMDKRLRVMLDTMVGVSEFDETGLLRFSRPALDQRFDEPLSGFYWQISSRTEEAFRSRSLWDQALEADFDRRVVSGQYSTITGPESQRIRLLEQDIILPERDSVYRYSVALNTAEIDQAIFRFDQVLKWALALIGLTLFLSIMVQSYLIMLPIKRMGRRIKEVRSGQLARIEGDFPTEINPVKSEINALLSHNETVLSRARTHVGNLAHALKTPLSVLKNQAQDRRDTDMVAAVDTMQRHIDHHLKRARVSGRIKGGGVPVKSCTEKLIGVMEMIFREKNPVFSYRGGEYRGEPDIKFAGEEEDLNEILGNLLENACKYGGPSIFITCEAKMHSANRVDHSGESDKPMMALIVEDNGQGVKKEQLSHILERGKRLDSTTKGSGLGLAIVADVVEIYGGSIKVDLSQHGGLKVSLYLPMVSAG